MSLIINHNLMAMNAARNLSTVYGRLATSTQRLSSGLRINSAADDAAGLAIREMMRADIAVLNQGMRNAADGISLIQTAEGALSVIDEKLIRMKELAEQASTGTYTTAQREIMNSEYQAMAAEIDRIANATDFNGLKLLDGTTQYQHNGSGLKVHFGAGNSESEDYYFINLGDARATVGTGLRIGGDAKNDIWGQGGVNEDGEVAGCCGGGINSMDDPLEGHSGEVFAYYYNYTKDTTLESADGTVIYRDISTPSYLAGMYEVESGQSLQELVNNVNAGTQSRIKVDFSTSAAANATLVTTGGAYMICLGEEVYAFGTGAEASAYNDKDVYHEGMLAGATSATMSNALASAINLCSTSFWAMTSGTGDGAVYVFTKDGGDFDFLVGCETTLGASAACAAQYVEFQNMETYEWSDTGTDFANGGESWGTMTGTEISPNQWGVNLHGRDVGDHYNLAIATVGSGASAQSAFGAWLDHAGSGMDSNESAISLTGFSAWDFAELQDAADAEWVGAEIRSQSTAQMALDALGDAIEKKDKIRADLGALQNRLENTMTNLSIQAENLQASESRISDIDVATEMTEFTKNNIMAQAATSMLAQANSLAQLALSLMG